MIHDSILKTIKKERLKEQFLYPDYGRYSIAEIGQSVLAYFSLTPKRPALPIDFQAGRNKIIMFLADGFGFDHFLQAKDKYPVFTKLEGQGDLYPLTSVFPSTTAAAL